MSSNDPKDIITDVGKEVVVAGWWIREGTEHGKDLGASRVWHGDI